MLEFLNGNVGIGTSIPTQALDVSGGINFNGELYKNNILFTGSKWLQSSISSTVNGVIGWGSDNYEQLSILPDALSNIIAIAAGERHSLALTNTGRVIGWGANGGNQITIPNDALSNIITITSNGRHSLALTNTGRVVGWGTNDFGQITIPSDASSNIIAIATGYYHSLALTNTGRVIGWGNYAYGQITIPNDASSNIIAISGGFLHSLALTNTGKVIGWGRNNFGQITIPSDASSNIIAIAAGYYHSLALTNTGRVIGWGDNYFGQINIPSNASSNIIAIYCGYDFSLALTNTGRVIGWGDNTYGQITIPSDASSNIIAISAGYYHSLAIKSNNSVTSNIYNINSNVGIGTSIPTQALDVTGNFKQLSNAINIIRTASTSSSLTSGSNKYIGFDIAWSNVMSDDLSTFRITGRCHLIKSDTEYAYRRFEVLITPKDDISNNKPKLLLATEASNYITSGFSNLTTTVTRLSGISIRLKVQWDSSVTSYYGTLQIEVCALQNLGVFSFNGIKG